MSKPHRDLPYPIFHMLQETGAWIVGSGVQWYLGGAETQLRDLDVVVPPRDWHRATRFLREEGSEVQVNHFGGFKAQCQDWEIDIWPQHLEDYFGPTDGGFYPLQALRLSPFTHLKQSSS